MLTAWRIPIPAISIPNRSATSSRPGSSRTVRSSTQPSEGEQSQPPEPQVVGDIQHRQETGGGGGTQTRPRLDWGPGEGTPIELRSAGPLGEILTHEVECRRRVRTELIVIAVAVGGDAV